MGDRRRIVHRHGLPHGGHFFLLPVSGSLNSGIRLEQRRPGRRIRRVYEPLRHLQPEGGLHPGAERT